MQTYNVSDNSKLVDYINNTNAKLKIMSVPTQMIIEFPAFITDFSQTFDAKWNTEEVFGRMDPIATYQGTQRKMSLGFDLPAGSIGEAKANLKGCSELIKMVYPIYGMGATDMFVQDGDTVAEEFVRDQGMVIGDFVDDEFREVLAKGKGVLSKPPLVRIKFANLINATDPNGLLGWIGGLSWKPNLEMGMFAANQEFYPKVITLSFSFNILHEQTLSQNTLGSFPFGGT